MSSSRRRVVIMGAAGRDFHNFLQVFRDDPGVEVVAFTAAQIPGIAGRRFPASLAGAPTQAASRSSTSSSWSSWSASTTSTRWCSPTATSATLAVMHQASRALASGADFALLGPARTMLRARAR